MTANKKAEDSNPQGAHDVAAARASLEETRQMLKKMIDLWSKPVEKLRTSPMSAREIHELKENFDQLLKELREKNNQLAKAMGMSFDEMSAFAEDKKNFSEQDWKLMGELKEKMNEFNQKLNKTVGEMVLRQERKQTDKRRPKGFIKKSDWVAM